MEGETQGRVTVEPPESRWRRRKDSRRDMDFCVCCDAALLMGRPIPLVHGRESAGG